MNKEIKILTITSPSFSNGGMIPKKHTGFDIDISPEFHIENLPEKTSSIAIIMDDLDVPFRNEFTHWLIWNIPSTNVLPENIPYETTVKNLGNAIQGMAWGEHRYRGPKQPFFVRNTHRYRFVFYALDLFLDINENSNKDKLLTAMQDHILATGTITGNYKR